MNKTLAVKKTARNETQKRFPRLVIDLFEGKTVQKHGVLDIIAQHFRSFSKESKMRERRLYRDILLALFEQKCFEALRDEACLMAVCRISIFGRCTLKDVRSWKRTSRNPKKQVISVAKFCFVHYKIPSFMDQVWFQADATYHEWYVDLGKGVSPRKLRNMPINLTKKMAHLFMQTPDDLVVGQALRLAQALAIGAPKALAMSIAFSGLSRNEFEHEAFWVSLIHLFVNAGTFDYRQVPLIVDYLSHELRERPNISVRGRTVDSLIRQSDDWHEEMTRLAMYGGSYTWDELGTKPVAVVKGRQGVKHVYRMVELLSTKELTSEGKRMGHCVASYARDCAEGRCAIFSIREFLDDDIAVKRLATVEVNIGSSMVVQAKAKYNQEINALAEEILKAWARKNAFTIANYL